MLLQTLTSVVLPMVLCASMLSIWGCYTHPLGAAQPSLCLGAAEKGVTTKLSGFFGTRVVCCYATCVLHAINAHSSRRTNTALDCLPKRLLQSTTRWALPLLVVHYTMHLVGAPIVGSISQCNILARSSLVTGRHKIEALGSGRYRVVAESREPPSFWQSYLVRTHETGGI